MRHADSTKLGGESVSPARSSSTIRRDPERLHRSRNRGMRARKPAFRSTSCRRLDSRACNLRRDCALVGRKARGITLAGGSPPPCDAPASYRICASPGRMRTLPPWVWISRVALITPQSCQRSATPGSGDSSARFIDQRQYQRYHFIHDAVARGRCELRSLRLPIETPGLVSKNHSANSGSHRFLTSLVIGKVSRLPRRRIVLKR